MLWINLKTCISLCKKIMCNHIFYSNYLKLIMHLDMDCGLYYYSCLYSPNPGLYFKDNKIWMCMCVCSVLSGSVTPWTVSSWAPLFMGFPRQEYWSGFAFPSQIRGSFRSRDQTHNFCVSCIGRWILYHWATWEAHNYANVNMVFWDLPEIYIC